VDNIAIQVTIESSSASSLQESLSRDKLEFIKTQKENRYLPKNCPSYLVHLEIDDNIENFILSDWVNL